jgi:GNAT superfamily N-acetyltransferase
MTLAGLKIRPLQAAELVLLRSFTPLDWNTDVYLQFRFHFGQPYFHPVAAELAGRIVGCGNALASGKAGWLGNIIVLPEYRKQGIGSALTTTLMEHLSAQGCTSLILTATRMGEPVYTKLGFTTRSDYAFLQDLTRITEPGGPEAFKPGLQGYKSGPHLARRLFERRPIRQIRRAGAKDLEAMRALDEEITGEKRATFLERYKADGWVYQRGKENAITGFLLRGLEESPIIAREPQAGLALLDFKTRTRQSSFVIPSTNTTAIDFMIAVGYTVRHTMPRMVLGPELDWRPEGVFSRAAGFCG